MVNNSYLTATKSSTGAIYYKPDYAEGSGRLVGPAQFKVVFKPSDFGVLGRIGTFFQNLGSGPNYIIKVIPRARG